MATVTGDIFGGDEASLEIGAGAGPGRPGQVLRLNPKTRQRHLDWLTWGLLPHDTTNPETAPRPIHARAETVAEIPTFASAFRSRRALVPISEYFQRRTRGGADDRFAIFRKDRQPMAVAGLWESYLRPGGEIVRTYCILTVEAVAPVAAIHDRMPLMLEEQDWPLWLGEVPGDPAALLHPPSGDVLVVRPIGGQRSTTRH
ncbi:MAG TPA: SOS response-associated peptidase [Reyranella sp.]